MTTVAAPIQQQASVVLVECGVAGVREATVQSGANTDSIEWDRYTRLQQTANAVLATHRPAGEIVLDVGGFDGALALFLPNHRVWIVDPATTGASGDTLPFTDKQFNVVVSVDALEHVDRSARCKFLSELVRVCRTTLLINFPAARSMNAQRTVLSLTNNRFIAEHVTFKLPSAEETIEQLQQKCNAKLMINVLSFTSIAVWLPWFVLLQKDRPSALALSAVLKRETQLSNQAPFLYDLLICTRVDD